MHPAHIPRAIVEAARKDAIDVLHWSYTDRLLTHPHLPPTPPPFSQDECLELLKLLNGKANACVSVRFVPDCLIQTRTIQLLQHTLAWLPAFFCAVVSDALQDH